MRIKCNSHCSTAPALVLPRNLNQVLDENNFVAYCGYTIHGALCGYDVSVGNEYEVYGVLAYNGQIRYLIQDNGNNPVFCPCELFSITTPTVYWDWRVKAIDIADKKLLLLAYPPLLEAYQNLVALVDSRSEAIEDFLAYKEFMKKYDIISP